MSKLRTCTICFLLSAFVLGPVTWPYSFYNKSSQVLVSIESSKNAGGANTAELPGKDMGSTQIKPMHLTMDRAEPVLQLHGVKFAIERMNETDVALVASMPAGEGLKQCGTTRNSILLDNMIPDPNPEPPIVSWKFGQRVAFMFGSVCAKDKELKQSIHECKTFDLRSPCLKGNAWRKMCLIYIKSHRPCFVTKTSMMTWKDLTKSRYQSMIDIGTNVGDSANLFPHFGIEVWGFDPMPENIFWLKLNKMANMVSGVTLPLHIFEGGASDRDTDVFFTDSGSAGNTHIVNEPEDNTKTIRRHVFKVDDHIKQPVGVFKIDCEGHEPEAFMGALELLCKYGAESVQFRYVPKAISTSSRMAAEAFLDLIADAGYEKCWQEWKESDKWITLNLRKRSFHSLQGQDHIICQLRQGSIRKRCAAFDRQNHPDLPANVIQLGQTRFAVERVNDTVSLIAFRAAPEGLLQCGGSRRVSTMLDGNIPDPKPEPPIASWKYGERVALMFGKLCDKHSKWVKNLYIGCKSGRLFSRCLKGDVLGTMCLIFPNPERPCHLTQDNVIMWKQLQSVGSWSMIDIGTNVGDSANMFPHWGVEVWGFDPMPENIFWLKLNKMANMMSGVTLPLHIFEGGASDRDADVFFTDSGSAGNTHIVNEPGNTTKTIRRHVFKVDDHIKQPVGLFKMDCEGHEPEALMGALELLCKYGAKIIQFEFSPAALRANSRIAPGAFLKTLEDIGYENCKQEWFDAQWNKFNLSLPFRSLNNGRDDIVCKPWGGSRRPLCAQFDQTARKG